jgi:hypothetical protein
VVDYVVYTGQRENRQMLLDNNNSSVALAMCLLPSLKLHHLLAILNEQVRKKAIYTKALTSCRLT